MSEEERQAKVRATLKLKKDVSALLTNVRAQAAIAERYANENQYLKEYIGSSMKSGDLKRDLDVVKTLINFSVRVSLADVYSVHILPPGIALRSPRSTGECEPKLNELNRAVEVCVDLSRNSNSYLALFWLYYKRVQ